MKRVEGRLDRGEEERGECRGGVANRKFLGLL